MCGEIIAFHFNFSTGLWLEFDDLKYPNCITHRRLTLPASQFHLIFWEACSKEESQLPDPLPDNTPTLGTSKVIDIFQDVPNSEPDNTCIMKTLTGNEDNEAASTCNSSIDSTTLSDTFEGLLHSDIVTLTLVEVKAGAEENPLPNLQEMVIRPVKSCVTEAFHLLEKSTYPPCSEKNKLGDAKEVSHTPEVILPSEVKASQSVDPPKVSKCPPALHSSNPNVSKPSLCHQQPSHQSTPLRVPLHAMRPKVDPRFYGNEAVLAKPAELYGGYRTKNSPNPVLLGEHLSPPFVKLPTVPQKTFSCPGGITSVGPVSTVIKSASQNNSKMVLSTEALRLKLMKRLKAKKKKLAKLNQLLSLEEGESTPRPDSTAVSSPYSVTSSTSAYDSPAFDNFFAEILSPDMSAGNLSPDSTGLLEILTNIQSAGASESSSQKNSAPASNLPVPPLNGTSSDDFLDELISGSREQQSVIESAELNAFDIFF